MSHDPDIHFDKLNNRMTGYRYGDGDIAPSNVTKDFTGEFLCSMCYETLVSEKKIPEKVIIHGRPKRGGGEDGRTRHTSR